MLTLNLGRHFLPNQKNLETFLAPEGIARLEVGGRADCKCRIFERKNVCPTARLVTTVPYGALHTAEQGLPITYPTT
jgi:hypothetical protein